MNKNIKLAVAGAVLALSATANAGIIIPAGDWTVDLGGNVNAFVSNVDTETTTAAGVKTKGTDSNTIGTGLLPSALGIGAKTRQNDIDTAIQFTFFTGSSAGSDGGRNGSAGGNNSLNIRQAFLTFGDKSWGTFKLGRDLGIFGSDAILSDMTLLGVGIGGAPGGSSTLGRIGSGYIYADWKGQVSYASPNFNGFQISAGVMENFGAANQAQKDLSYEAKATYDFAASDVTGRIWVSGLTQKSQGLDAITASGATALPTGGIAGTTATAAQTAGNSYTSRGVDVGAKLTAGPATLVGYYYDGKGLDGQAGRAGGLFNDNGVKSDDDGGYVQGTVVVPGVGTKLGASWGRSNSKHTASTFDIENESWIVGAYHPLTKHLNLVAEYVNNEIKNKAATSASTAKIERDTVSLGAILFF
jgi:predicted porin